MRPSVIEFLEFGLDLRVSGCMLPKALPPPTHTPIKLKWNVKETNIIIGGKRGEAVFISHAAEFKTQTIKPENVVSY